jgi:D-arginine dehydrogenase
MKRGPVPLHSPEIRPARKAPAPPRGPAPGGASPGDAEGGATLPSLAHDPGPVPCLAHDWDFIVIGGGIAGTSAGARLSDLGSVLLLEAETALAYHASGRSAALYEANYGHPVTIALNKASREEFDTLDGGFLSPRGLMLLGGPGEEAEARGGYRHDGLEPDRAGGGAGACPDPRPGHITRAAFHDGAWDIDTDRMVQHFARTIRDNGGACTPGSPVAAIARDGRRAGASRRTRRETHEARASS